MLRRLGFRRILPIVQLLLYLIPVGPDSIYLYRVLAESSNPTCQPASLQEGIEFHPVYIDRTTPTGVMVAVLLNLPAAVLGVVVVAPFRPEGTKAELLDRLIMAPLVVILWYAVGLWIDRRLEFIPAKQYTYSNRRLALWWGFYSLSMILLGLGLAGLVFAMLWVRNMLPGLPSIEIVVIPFSLIPLAWLAFFFVVCSSGLRRVRGAAPQNN